MVETEVNYCLLYRVVRVSLMPLLKFQPIKTHECLLTTGRSNGSYIPVETSFRVVMIATAKIKVARAVKSEETAMADAIKNNGLCFTVAESLYGCVSTFGFACGVSFLKTTLS